MLTADLILETLLEQDNPPKSLLLSDFFLRTWTAHERWRSLQRLLSHLQASGSAWALPKVKFPAHRCTVESVWLNGSYRYHLRIHDLDPLAVDLFQQIDAILTAKSSTRYVPLLVKNTICLRLESDRRIAGRYPQEWCADQQFFTLEGTCKMHFYRGGKCFALLFLCYD